MPQGPPFSNRPTNVQCTLYVVEYDNQTVVLWNQFPCTEGNKFSHHLKGSILRTFDLEISDDSDPVEEK